MIDELNSNTYQDYITVNELVILEFGATWCAPCKMTLPILEKTSINRNDIKIASIDIEDSPDTAKEYKVSAIPTIILLKDGVEIKRNTGAISYQALETFINT